MKKLKILNTREVKRILALLKAQWGFAHKLDYVFLMNEKSRIFITNRDFARLQTEKLRINSVGLYFGELTHNELRLTIEGSQLIGPGAEKNVVELTEEEEYEWLRGSDLKKKAPKGFVILKHKTHYLGCGKAKNGNILNFVPKTRRIK